MGIRREACRRNNEPVGSSLSRDTFSSPFLLLDLAIVSILAFPQQARSDFWSLRNKGQPETVKLIRKLPPVAARQGSTVRFIPEVAGASTPPETATILKEKVRTLLLNSQAGGIQLVDGPADTIIKCIVTGYEPKSTHFSNREVGNTQQKIVTWIGNMTASVQILDPQGNPIDSGNLKEHLESDFVVSEQEEKVKPVTRKGSSLMDRVANTAKTLKGGGDTGDVGGLVGGQQVHDALKTDAKNARQPTDLEWRDALIEALATKVANRIVPVDQEFVAILPLDKEFTQIRELAKGNRWGEVQEQAEKMAPLKGAADAFRLYSIGLSQEAIAYQDAGSPDKAVDLLNKASKFYDDAHQLKPGERELLLAQIRAQDSLDHYLEIQHFLQTRAKMPPQQSAGQVKTPDQTSSSGAGTAGDHSAGPGTRADNASNNAALIAMVEANMPENILLTFVKTAPDPKFDASANGLLQLGRAKVPSTVIEAVQKRMAPAPAIPAPARRTQPPKHPAPPSAAN